MGSRSTSHELSALCLELYDGSASAVKSCQRLQDPLLDKGLFLRSIPAPAQPSHRPLYLLYVALSQLPGDWPVFDLIACHTKVLKFLPETAKNGADDEIERLLKSTQELVKKSYGAFSDFLHGDGRPALSTTSPQSFITHRGLQRFAKTLRLPVAPFSKKPIVAIAVPNGPLLAATCIAVTTYYTSAPINPAAGAEQFQADVEQSGASFILTTADEYEKLQMQDWTRDGPQVFLVEWDGLDGISLSEVNGSPLAVPTAAAAGERSYNTADDIGLILFTSGTSGTKKVVPLTIHSIVAGIVFVIDSWGLTPSDVCLNMMPLYHV
jgi:hypothetical protein